MITRIIAAILLLWMFGFAAFSIFLPRPAGPVRTDAVVVLTGAGGRIERGLEAIDNKWAERMLISGVDQDVRPQELIAQYDMSDALFECCVDLGFRAIDTRSNAEETANWAKRRKANTIRLVTTDWHMRRAHYELRRALPEDTVIYDDAVASNPSLMILFLEYNKYILRVASGLLGV